MTNQTIPKRSEVPEEMTWNLKDMFASDEAWMTEYEAMKAFPAKIAAFQGTLARSAGDLLAWFRLQDEIELRLSVLMGYASCKGCLLYTSPSPRDMRRTRMPSSA